MEKTEPTFVPEWLKNNGSLSTSSSLHSDDQGVSKSLRINNSGPRPSVSDRTTSSYFRRSYSNFGRNHRDRDWEKDYSDPLANILPSRFEKDGLRRSHSSLSAKKSESWNRKIVSERNGNNNNGKMLFERDFPSLVVEDKDKQADYEIGRIPSPGLTTAIQSLPVGNVAVIGGDGWTSALAEVPVMVQPTPVVAPGRNMAETLAQGPPRAQTAPQLSVGTQRLEELAVKQSRQLIPVTPPMPKTLAMNSSEKSKLKVGQPSPRHVSIKSDVSKSSSVGKLHVLKPSRERNGTISKETLSPTSGTSTKLPNYPHAVPSPLLSLPLRNTNSTSSVSLNLEKRPSPQAQSRNDFFNLVRKKSMATNSSAPAGPVSPLGAEAPGGGGVDRSTDGGKGSLGNDVILYSEEEEARFLRSLGWEEETSEEGGLTEEEINSFYRDVSKYVKKRTASNFFKGAQPKCLMPVMQMGKNGDISADSKVDS